MIAKLKTLLAPPVEENDSSLVEFRRYYDEHHSYVRSIIYWMVRSDDVDDLVQETFVKAWKYFASFRGDSEFRTWIHRIAMNTVYDFYRKNKTKPVLQATVPVHQFENKDLISKGLLELKPELREVLILNFKFGLSMEEIAKIQEIKVGTVKSRLFSAKEKFKEFCLKEGVSYE